MLGYCENPADDKWEAPGIINKTSVCILKNDYACKYMGFSPTKGERLRRRKIMG